jgi:hypothetical protein
MTELRTAGLGRYLAEAFLFRWNLLLFLGGMTGAALSPLSDVLIPLVGAGELAYLASLTSIPRFRAAIDAKLYGEQKGPLATTTVPAPTLAGMLTGLQPDARNRFERLHARCREMRGIAAGVRGATGDQSESSDNMATPGLDRLLWLFLRLLVSKTALDRFLRTMNEQEMTTRLESLRKSLEAAQKATDERVTKSLQDSVAMGELRLDNFQRAKKNAEFVSLELDRIEGKIQALAEMAVNRQDPDFLSGQADAAAESMRQTEKAVSELQHLTGLGEQLEEPPPILESDLRQVLKQ